jgi:hypothetical protein
LTPISEHRRSSEPQVVSAQLIDGSATHQLHVPLDFCTQIPESPFNTGLTRSRKGIQVEPPPRASLRTNGKGLQDVRAAPHATVADHIYSVADSVDDLG